MWLLIPALLTIHVIICLLLVLVVLMQLPRSEGLGTAFGSGVTQDILGAQATNVFAKFTVWLGVAFFIVTLALAMAYTKQNSAKGSPIQRQLQESAAVAPAASPVATPAESTAALPSPTAAPAVSTEAPAAPVEAPAVAPVASPAASPVASPAQ